MQLRRLNEIMHFQSLTCGEHAVSEGPFYFLTVLNDFTSSVQSMLSSGCQSKERFGGLPKAQLRIRGGSRGWSSWPCNSSLAPPAVLHRLHGGEGRFGLYVKEN